MALLEGEATRLALVLGDYDNVSVSLQGDADSEGFSLIVRDHRFELDYEIASHYDYWDFIGALVDHKQYIARALQTLAA